MSAGLLVIAVACDGDSPVALMGSGCILDSDCQAPLVCAYERCHAACEETRDCPEGSRCVVVDKPLSVCQLEDEQTCAFTSDCPAGQICAPDLECHMQCLASEDCPAGEVCVDNACALPEELVDGKLPGAAPPDEPECYYDSQCPEGLECREGSCKVPCLGDADCPVNHLCTDDGQCELDPTKVPCVPGEQDSCDCPTGGIGYQICTPAFTPGPCLGCQSGTGASGNGGNGASSSGGTGGMSTSSSGGGGNGGVGGSTTSSTGGGGSGGTGGSTTSSSTGGGGSGGTGGSTTSSSAGGGGSGGTSGPTTTSTTGGGGNGGSGGITTSTTSTGGLGGGATMTSTGTVTAGLTSDFTVTRFDEALPFDPSWLAGAYRGPSVLATGGLGPRPSGVHVEAESFSSAGTIVVGGHYAEAGVSPMRRGIAYEEDASGRVAWSLSLEGEGEQLVLGVASRGELRAVCGVFRGELTVQGERLASEGGWDGFVLVVDARGRVVAVEQLGGPGDQVASAVQLTSTGILVVAGAFERDLSIGSATLESQGGRDAFTVWLTSATGYVGAVRWGGAGDEAATRMVVTDASVVVAGHTTQRGDSDAFVAWARPEGLSDLRILGGAGVQSVLELALDVDGFPWVTAFSAFDLSPVLGPTPALDPGWAGPSLRGARYLFGLPR